MEHHCGNEKPKTGKQEDGKTGIEDTRIRYSNIRNKVDAASSRVSPAASKWPNAPLQLDYDYEHRPAKAELSTSTKHDEEMMGIEDTCIRGYN